MVSSYGTNQAATFTVTDTKLFVPVVTLPTKDNVKLRQKLKSGSKRTYNQNKYQSKVIKQEEIV